MIRASDPERQAEVDRWRAVHIRGDRNPAIYLPDRNRARTRGAGCHRAWGTQEELI